MKTQKQNERKKKHKEEEEEEEEEEENTVYVLENSIQSNLQISGGEKNPLAGWFFQSCLN